MTRWSSFVSSTVPGGTARWQAPELFNPDVDIIKPTKMSDIYSLGCVFYEVSICFLSLIGVLTLMEPCPREDIYRPYPVLRSTSRTNCDLVGASGEETIEAFT